jgi:N-succinyldiaminopimelate aminotransferase
MPLHHQLASVAAWQDENHVVRNRQLYRAKFSAVLDILGNDLEVAAPQAGFYLWPRTRASDAELARDLYARQAVTVLPGRFLARTSDGLNPGDNHLRLALVATLDDCTEAAQRIVTHLQGA